MTHEQFILAMAKRIFLFNHPRKSWIAHPDYKQLTEQSRYIEIAKVLFNMVEERIGYDPNS